MKFSENWLREWVNPPLSSAELQQRLTLAGLEVSAVGAPFAFSQVVVARVESLSTLSTTEILNLCTIFDGNKRYQVVCGAHNVRQNLKVAFAPPGAQLPGIGIIGTKNIQGIQSSGMICSEAELGIGNENDKILELDAEAELGRLVCSALGLEDQQIDLELTPNRADCLSIRGIAREVSVLCNLDFQEPQVTAVTPATDATLALSVLTPKACPRYVGRVICGINPKQKVPSWLNARLLAAGIRSIDPIVDITNYVMLEMGQPLHGFDLASIDEHIVVRMATSGDRLTLLDGREIHPTPDTLLICDKHKALALAGIMGGKDSGISANTRDIFLESALFTPRSLAGRARNYGLHTEAAHRFERGIDYRLQEVALERATALIVSLCGGKSGPVLVVQDKCEVPKPVEITLRRRQILRILGIEISDQRVENILTGLQMRLSPCQEGWKVRVPSFRFDLQREIDLIEEVIRIHGYDRITAIMPTAQQVLIAESETQKSLGELAQQLVTQGFCEVINYSFLNPNLQNLFFPEEKTMQLVNPISQDQSVMRTSLVPGLMHTLRTNFHRQQQRMRIFETGLVFQLDAGELKQQSYLAAAITGSRYPLSWTGNDAQSDFYDIKGILESILVGTNICISQGLEPILHPGQSSILLCSNRQVGYFGTLHPQLQNKLGLIKPVYFFEVLLDAIQTRQLVHFVPVSKYPESKRDLAVLIDQEVSASDVLHTIKKSGKPFLKATNIFDIYQGESVPQGKKSIALGLTLQHPSRTLTDEEVSSVLNLMISRLRERFDAKLRIEL